MAEKKYYWLKIETDFFNQKEIKKLRKIAGGDTYTVIYLKMALLSLKDEGMLYFEGIEDNIAEELALELDEETENVKVVVNFLEKYKMLQVVDEKEVYLNRIPEMTGSETEAAKRMRRMRKGVTCNNVTQISNDVLECSEVFDSKSKSKELDIDIEKEQDKYTCLFEHYKSKANLINHRKLNKTMKTAIDKAISELGIDTEEMKRVIDRHSEKVESTKNNELSIKVRTLDELFGQKKYKSSSLICSDYTDEVWQREKNEDEYYEWKGKKYKTKGMKSQDKMSLEALGAKLFRGGIEIDYTSGDEEIIYEG